MIEAPLFSLAENPCPPGGTAVFINNGDIKLRVARWPASAPSPRGTVILAHGRTEFIEKYYEVIGELLERGFEVFTFDWRGQGLSSRELETRTRGHIKSYDDYFSDLDCIFASDIAKDLPVPRSLLVHSMGCNITFRYLQAHPDLVGRAVFSAPMFGIGARTAQGILHGLSKIALAAGKGEDEPFFSKTGDPAQEAFETNAVTSDHKRFERTKKTIAAKPELGLSGLSWAWVKASFDSTRTMWQPEFLEHYKVPSLFIAAGREKLVTSDAAARLASLAQPCEAVTIEGALHEIMMEREPFRRQFWALFDEFLSRG